MHIKDSFNNSEKRSLFIPIIVILISAAVIAVCFLLGGNSGSKQLTDDTEYKVIRKVDPDCVAAGYTEVETEDGSILFVDYLPPLGHKLDSGTVVQEMTDVCCRITERRCLECGMTITETEYPEQELGVLKLNGSMEGIGKKSSVLMTADFSGQGQSFSAYADVKHQGHSTLQYDKKNYTVKFYSDQDYTDKLKLSFGTWHKESKYILKANYCDSSQCRNIVCAKLWSEIVASRNNINDRLANTPAFGAVDGFPVILYINDEFAGLYTFNLHKDDDLFEMEEGREDYIAILNYANTPAAFFREEDSFPGEENETWEIEFSGEGDFSPAKDKLNELIRFVMNSSDEEFKSSLGKYLDVDSAIDYLIAVYALGLHDNATKDIVLSSYDDGPWIAGMYDLENAFGMSADGREFAEASEHLPVYVSGKWDSGTGSLLWDRLLNLFADEIAQRYAFLRSSMLTTSHICDMVSKFTAQISDELYEADAQLYADEPTAKLDHGKQIEEYITERLALLDKIFTERG